MAKLNKLIGIGLIGSMCTFCTVTTPTLFAAPPTINPNSNDFTTMLQRATPAVVNIVAQKEIPFLLELLMQPRSQQGDNDENNQNGPGEGESAPPSIPGLPDKFTTLGSGVIIDAAHGLIVTNAHVVHSSKDIIVTLKNGRRFRAVIVGEDTGFDIAVIRIPAKNLTEIPLANSNILEVGQPVAAVGSPFGLTQTVTRGIISSLNRTQPQLEGAQSYIQTDAPINPGNSGGALLNMNGQLIGINTAILTPTEASVGIGFAIPSNMVNLIVTQLLRFGKIKHGILGVMIQNLTPELADALHVSTTDGVIVTQVTPGSPAKAAGIELQDVIEKLDDQPIHNATLLHNMLALTPPGTKVTLTILRGGKEITLHPTVGDPKEIPQTLQSPLLAGLRLQDFEEMEPNGIFVKGVLVLNVDEKSEGALAGLAEGDIITQAANQPVTNMKDLTAIAKKNQDSLLLTVERDQGRLFIVLGM